MLDSSGSENGGVWENIYEFFEFYNWEPNFSVPELLLA
jgi:hypothetical protein